MTSSQDTQPKAAAEDSSEAPTSIFTPHRRAQFLVVVASVVCFLIFWYCGRWLGIPSERGYQASLLQQRAAVLAIVVTCVLLLGATALATAIVGRSWFFGGPFCAMVGLIAFSARGGPMRDILFGASGPHPQNVFLVLFVELLVLFIPIGLLWSFFVGRYDLVREQSQPHKDGPQSPVLETVTSLAIQIAVMGVVLLILAPTDKKKQVLVASFVAGLTGTGLAEHYAARLHNRLAGRWYWIGPLIVGAIGYLVAYAMAPSSGNWLAGWVLGNPGGALAALARPLPLDYASAAAAGALLGYWIGLDRPEIAVSVLGGLFGGHATIPRPAPPAPAQQSTPPTPKKQAS